MKKRLSKLNSQKFRLIGGIGLMAFWLWAARDLPGWAFFGLTAITLFNFYGWGHRHAWEAQAKRVDNLVKLVKTQGIIINQQKAVVVTSLVMQSADYKEEIVEINIPMSLN
jgi:hypothetical protein